MQKKNSRILFVLQDGSCNGLQHYAALGRDEVILCCFLLAGACVASYHDNVYFIM